MKTPTDSSGNQHSIPTQAAALYQDFLHSLPGGHIPAAEVTKLLEAFISKYSDHPKYSLLRDAFFECDDANLEENLG